MTPPAPQTPTRRQQQHMRQHFRPDLTQCPPITGFNRQTSLFVEVTHFQRDCAFTSSSPYPPGNVCVCASRHRQTGRTRRLKITTPCARWRWNRHCATAHSSRRICTALFSDGAVFFFFFPTRDLCLFHGGLINLSRWPETD